MTLAKALLTAACRCAPPDNRPSPGEFANCRGYLERELELARSPRVVVALGALAFGECLTALSRGRDLPSPRPRFSHGARVALGDDVLYGSYHPSQQNTFTGKLTPAMLRAVLRRALKESLRPRQDRVAGR
jgi:uracil-DNA glycosylase family 4